jgi:hypothetical protein
MAPNKQHTVKEPIAAHAGLLIYFQRTSTSADGSPSIEIAVIEDKRHAERYESRGYTRCSMDEFRAAWRLRDEHSLARLRAAAVAEGQPVASQPATSPSEAYQGLFGNSRPNV